MFDLDKLTIEVCEIAKEVGLFQKKERVNFSLDRVEQKHSHDYVSYVDKTSEELIVNRLKKLLPQAGFITEEGTVEQSIGGLNWIIDPLDGTTNYIHDFAPYCVSIALRDEDDLLIGVVYEVCRDECFYAWQGGGAYMNGKQINVSEKLIGEAFVGLDLPYNATAYKSVVLNVVNKLYGKVSSLRLNGSAAMSMCYVAIGRYDGWAEAFISPWDYAAGALIVKEAGGKVTNFLGTNNITSTHHVVASNGVIHEELREVFNVIGV